MSAAGIVEGVDVFEEGDFNVAAGLPIAAPDQFRLKRLEEAFHCGIVITISLPAHRYLEPVLAQKLLVGVGAVLRKPSPRAVFLGVSLRRGPSF